jgi:hypothetical protein
MNKLTLSLIVVILILMVGELVTCNQLRVERQSFKGTIALQNKLLNDTCKYIKGKQGQIISLQKAIDLTNADFKNIKDSLMSVIMNIKASKIQYVTKIVSNVQIRDSITHDSVRINKPVPFKDSNKNYVIKGIAEINKTIFTDIYIPNTMYLVHLTNGTVEAMNSNPLIRTTNILAIDKVQPVKKWVCYIGLGYGVYKNGLSPTINVGVGWKIFQF